MSATRLETGPDPCSHSQMSGAETTLTRIRDATRVRHERLEARIDLVGRLTDVAAYRQQLAAMYGFYEPFEARLAALDWRDCAIDFGARRKSAALRADLAFLGYDGPALGHLERIADSALPAPASAPAAIGCLYVLEGATLGGTIIARHVRRTLPPLAHGALAFYDGYGGRTGLMWRSFREALASLCDDDEPAGEEAALAACATFDGLERWLERKLA